MLKLLSILKNEAIESFKPLLKAELESFEKGTLPLDHGLSQGGLVDDSDISVTVLNRREDEVTISVKVGIFFTERVGHCSCSDDFELSDYNAYCEMLVCIDKQTAEVEFVTI